MTPGLISVLIPSRGRPDLLAEAVASLLGLAAEPDRVEILAALDPDDPADPGAYLGIPATFSVQPERYGYKGLHRYYNALTDLADGEWLFVGNDDFVMRTAGWDEIIRSQPPAILWAEPCNPHAPEGSPSEFPVLPAAWAAHLGHVSLHHSADMWLAEVGLMSGTGRHIPVVIVHGETRDATASERTCGPRFDSPALVAAREEDARRLKELIG